MRLKWVDASRRVVYFINENGAMESHLANSAVGLRLIRENGAPDAEDTPPEEDKISTVKDLTELLVAKGIFTEADITLTEK